MKDTKGEFLIALNFERKQPFVPTNFIFIMYYINKKKHKNRISTKNLFASLPT